MNNLAALAMVKGRLRVWVTTVGGGALFLPLLTACGSLPAYRHHDPVRLQGQFTTLETYSTEPVDPAAIDQLLLEVAGVLGVRLNPATPKARVVVTSPDRIARLHSSTPATPAASGYAAALYLPGAGVILVPHVDRSLLAHELAHYVTDNYLEVPRSMWEEIADRVERDLSATRPALPSPEAATGPPPPRRELPALFR